MNLDKLLRIKGDRDPATNEIVSRPFWRLRLERTNVTHVAPGAFDGFHITITQRAPEIAIEFDVAEGAFDYFNDEVAANVEHYIFLRIKSPSGNSEDFYDRGVILQR